MSCHEATNEVLKSVRGYFHSLEYFSYSSFRAILFDYFMRNKRSFSRVIIIERKVSSSFVLPVVHQLHLQHHPMHYGKSKSSSKIHVVVELVNGVHYFVSNILLRDNISLLKSTMIKHSMQHDKNYVVHQAHLYSLSFLFHMVTISHQSSNSIQRRLLEMKMLYLGVPMFDYNTSVPVLGYTRRISN